VLVRYRFVSADAVELAFIRINMMVKLGQIMPLPAYLGVFKRMSLGFILWDMARRLHNWSYYEVTDFLKENGFTFYKEVGGSHEAWIKPGKDDVPDTIVGLHFTHTNYHVETMKRIVRKSGIDEEIWIKWGSS